MTGQKKTWADKLTDYHFQLQPVGRLPGEVDWLLPFEEEETREATAEFYRKFYSDNKPRILLLGINPGRFGAGVTGIPFTDPIRLEEDCGIPNDFPKKREISSIFIYEMISTLGGPAAFYSKFLISSLCPLGFIKNGKNYNFYDDKVLEKAVTPFIRKNIQSLISFGGRDNHCLILGKGKNAQYFERLNSEFSFFQNYEVLPHPRWVMQYRLKDKDIYLDQYLQTLHSQT